MMCPLALLPSSIKAERHPALVDKDIMVTLAFTATSCNKEKPHPDRGDDR